MNEEIKAASVDSRQFHELAMDYRGASVEAAHGKYNALIAHINAWSDERCNQLAASRAMLPVTESQVMEAINAACGHGRVSLVNEEADVPRPTDVAMRFARALASPVAQSVLPVTASDDLRNRVQPRPLEYPLDAYWQAPSGVGPLAIAYENKPHRIYYDLIAALLYTPAASPVAGWVSVEDERKPAEHELVAVIGPAYGSFDKGRYVSSATYYNGEFFTEDGDMMHPPSHWCALPPAPVVTPTPTEQEQNNG